MKLSLRRKHKKRVLQRVKVPLDTPMHLSHTWSMDFMSDSLMDGRRIRVLNVIDDWNRESILIEPAMTFPAERVVVQLEQIAEQKGTPKVIRVDNGPEFIAAKFKEWCTKNGIRIQYTQPGRPMQNGYIERFNRFYREDVLDAYLFEDLETVRTISQQWQDDYNNNHPHKSLGCISPIAYKILNHKGNISSKVVKAKVNDSLQSSALTTFTEIL